MAKIESMSIGEFMSRSSNGDFTPVPTATRVIRHIDKHRVIYTVGGMTVIFLLTTALDGGMALAASSSIDTRVAPMYYKLVNVGKWIIVIKGGMEIINQSTSGDYAAVKKTFISHGLIFAALLALPWALDEIEALFEDIRVKPASGELR